MDIFKAELVDFVKSELRNSVTNHPRKRFIRPRKPSKAKSPQDAEEFKPFNFLALPPELRLAVYDQLTPEYQPHTILLKDGVSTVTIVNCTIPGLRILSANRLINTEASTLR